MRSRRRRLALVVAALAVLILATGLGFVSAGVDPSAGLFGLLGGTTGPTPSASAPGTGVAIASVSPGVGLASSGAGSSSGAPGASASGPSVASSSAAPPAIASLGPSASAVAASPQVAIAKAIAHGSRARPVVALTFDDGYDPISLRRILAILKREKVAATFFPYGWAVSRDPVDWKKVVAAGYPIGNHTLRHTTLTDVSLAQVYDEMTRGRATIDLYSGGTSGNFMRPPGGLYNKPIAQQIARAGYSTIVLWDVDTFDWKGISTAAILARATRGTNGSIVLMHAGPLNTPRALPAIIKNYRARGFTFVTIPQLLGIS